MGISIISDTERIAIDLSGVRFFARRVLGHEQAQVERLCTSKKGEVDYHKMTDELLKRHVTGWEPNPDPITENGEPAAFSAERLLRLPLDVKNELVGKLYQASPDHLGNSGPGSAAATPRAD
jgi:hypothetical protein